MININFPDITQENFDYALKCLSDCKQTDAKDYGFNYPYFAPGGQYGKQWWLLDSSLALSGYKWADRKFVETSLLNFIDSQKDNGRLCLYGCDILPEVVSGNGVPKQREGVSSLPKIFDVGYSILCGTTNATLIEKTYNMFKKYLDWWYSDRYDIKNGLFTSVFEETFIPYLGVAGEYAAVDTNVEIYVGLIYTAAIAERLNKKQESGEYIKKAKKLKNAIITMLWDDERGCFFPYNIKEEKLIDCLMASTFYPLRMNIATSEQKNRLIELLKNDEFFNWNTIPVTSVSKKDPLFQTTIGEYQGNDSWSGNVWTLINEMIVRGLSDCGEKKLAAELALKTIRAFNYKCSEFVNPFDGSAQGVEKYAWSASQYIELLAEVVFGISVIADKSEVFISPMLTDELKNDEISIKGLNVFDDIYLDVFIKNGKVEYNISDSRVKVKA